MKCLRCSSEKVVIINDNLRKINQNRDLSELKCICEACNHKFIVRNMRTQGSFSPKIWPFKK